MQCRCSTDMPDEKACQCFFEWNLGEVGEFWFWVGLRHGMYDPSRTPPFHLGFTYFTFCHPDCVLEFISYPSNHSAIWQGWRGWREERRAERWEKRRDSWKNEKVVFLCSRVPSLKLTCSPPKIGHPKRKFHLPTSNFQGRKCCPFRPKVDPNLKPMVPLATKTRVGWSLESFQKKSRHEKLPGGSMGVHASDFPLSGVIGIQSPWHGRMQTLCLVLETPGLPQWQGADFRKWRSSRNWRGYEYHEIFSFKFQYQLKNSLWFGKSPVYRHRAVDK